MTYGSLTIKTKLTLKNIEKMAPESPGAIILYNKHGIINNLIIAEESIKSELLMAFSNKTSCYFTFRETNLNLDLNKIVYI